MSLWEWVLKSKETGSKIDLEFAELKIFPNKHYLPPTKLHRVLPGLKPRSHISHDRIEDKSVFVRIKIHISDFGIAEI